MPSEVVVIALGGNAILRRGDRGSVDEMWRNIYMAAKPIVQLYSEGYRLVITHGNGPQIGVILEWFECARDKIPPLTMDIADAMTQGWIGYMLQQAIGNVMVEKGLPRKVVTIVNQVLVKGELEKPEKLVGPYYSYEDAMRISKEKGWIFKQDPRGGWRRAVPSPEPVENLETEAILSLLEKGYIVIASGGGGIPVIDSGGGVIKGVEAVVDKDLASALLALRIGASKLVILTDVDYVYIDYGKPTAKPIKRIKADEAIEMVEKGLFPPGSMAPKVKAAAIFTRSSGRNSHIGHLDEALNVFQGTSGTVIEPY
ncbi:MAG: carbamate kinase [Sulfolobales archaeon]